MEADPSLSDSRRGNGITARCIGAKSWPGMSELAGTMELISVHFLDKGAEEQEP